MAAAALVVAVAFSAMGQREGQPGQGGGFANMSEEQRTQMRERWQNMSEEERAQFREQMRGRMGEMGADQRAAMRGGFGVRLSREEQLKAIAAMQEQIGKLKAVVESQPEGRTMANMRDMSEEERTKLREEMTKRREAQTAAITAIETELAKFQGPRPERIGTARELQRIIAVAKEENAPKTAAALEAMVARAAAPAGDQGPATTPEGARRVRGERGAGQTGTADNPPR